jgi:hypothetical protein
MTVIIEELKKLKKYFSKHIPTTYEHHAYNFLDDLIKREESFPVEARVKPACERDIRIDELNKLQQTLNPYQMNENDFFRAMMNGIIKNTILTRINQLSKSV